MIREGAVGARPGITDAEFVLPVRLKCPSWLRRLSEAKSLP